MPQNENESRALARLRRMAALARQSTHGIRLGAGFAHAAARLRFLSAQVSLPRLPDSGESAAGDSQPRVPNSADNIDRFSRLTSRLSPALETLSRVERSNLSAQVRSSRKLDSPRDYGVPANLAALAPPTIAAVSDHYLANLDMTRNLATSIRPMTHLSTLAPREFAAPPAEPRDRSVAGSEAITINSSPTVVINSPAVSGGIERGALSALRIHREELFNQLQRESIRRERAQF